MNEKECMEKYSYQQNLLDLIDHTIKSRNTYYTIKFSIEFLIRKKNIKKKRKKAIELEMKKNSYLIMSCW